MMKQGKSKTLDELGGKGENRENQPMSVIGLDVALSLASCPINQIW
ncbi:MAG: hypothetical protein GWN62_18975 [Aliifodinibius sp.]|nr:hypothetical protein [Fodinibius sp.]